MFTTYEANAITIGHKEFDMSSADGKTATSILTGELNQLKDASIKDMFFRIERDGKSFAEIYIEDYLGTSTTIPGVTNRYTKGTLELMKASVNRGQDGDLSVDEIKLIITEIEKERAVELNKVATDEAIEKREELEAQNKSKKSYKMSLTTARDWIKNTAHGGSVEDPTTGTVWKYDSTGDGSWTDGSNVLNKGEFFHLLTGAKAKYLKP
jgi:hypothetical protein